MTALWLGPDLNADLVPLMEQPDQWASARAMLSGFLMFGQQTYADTPEQIAQWQVGPNYYARLADHGVFRWLTKQRLSPWFEVGAVKPDLSQEEAIRLLNLVMDRVEQAGGQVGGFTCDDPLYSAQHVLHMTIPQAADQIASVLEAGASRGVFGGITEAYPVGQAADIADCVHAVSARIRPTHLYLDIDAQALRSDAQVSHDLRLMQSTCAALGVRFGIIVNGQRASTPQSYHDEALAFLRRVPGWLGGWPDVLLLESWKKANLPSNLPETDPVSHTGLVLAVASDVHPSTEPNVTWTSVKVTGKTLSNPDGTVRSLNPASNDPPYGPYHWESRPAGTDGGYEVCAINGSMVVYNPTGKDPQVYGFCQEDPRNPGMSCMTVEPL